MNLGELRPADGSKTKAYRRGRGHASGNGKTSGRGHKGQKARSGGGVRPGFEGGQRPLYRRLPKRGHKSRGTKEIVAISLRLLEVFEDGQVVDINALKSKGLLANPKDGVKILGSGEISKKLTVQVHRFSKGAAQKIEAAGGKAEVI